MNSKEVFPNPTVKQVIFQIRFPNLFYLENKIGELQQRIMKEFPDSQLLFRKQIVFSDFGPDTKLDEYKDKATPDSVKKIWKFISPKGYDLNIMTDSLDITSVLHKTYDSPDSDNKFRDTIKFVLDNFYEVTKIPIITRIGLRYIDECPLIEKNNKTYKEWYNSTFPLSRFSIEDSTELDFRAVSKRGNYFIIFAESMKNINNELKLVLDFDGFANNIDFNEYLKVTDSLHEIISKEFKKSIKEPLKEYMRKGVEH